MRPVDKTRVTARNARMAGDNDHVRRCHRSCGDAVLASANDAACVTIITYRPTQRRLGWDVNDVRIPMPYDDRDA